MLQPSETTIHGARTTVANWCNATRKATALAFLMRGDEARSLRDNGIAVLPNFLPEDQFRRVRREAARAMDSAERTTPIRERLEPGFGAQEVHTWGFDRYDGGTLNRFIDLEPEKMPAVSAVARDDRISRLCRVVLGTQIPPRRTMIYLTVNGNENRNHDIQKDLHRDSYYRKIKFWYFLDSVSVDDGPFVYVPGSHRLTRQRLIWEREQAHKFGIPGWIRDRSYRIGEAELSDLALPQPQLVPVDGNTLVIADTFGFHRRGDALPGSRRLAIYAQKRPWPFTPFGV